MALFQKTHTELREMCVRARFAEKAIFGRLDIEEWLAEQRTRSSPDITTWESLLARSAFQESIPRGRESGMLQEYSHPSSTPNEGKEHPGAHERRKKIRPLLDIIGYADRCTIRFGYKHGDIFVCAGPGSKPFESWTIVFTDRPGARGGTSIVLEPLQPIHVVDVIFATWLRGCSSYHHKYQKYSPADVCPTECARQFLCDVLAQEIKKERAKAEADFDSAVAVSADGTKIVHADWVVVRDMKDNQKVYVFRGEQMRTYKALRPGGAGEFCRQTSNANGLSGALFKQCMSLASPAEITPDIIAAIVAREMRSHHTAPDPWLARLLNCYISSFKVRIYFTVADLYPSLLTAGGVEVTV